MKRALALLLCLVLLAGLFAGCTDTKNESASTAPSESRVPTTETPTEAPTEPVTAASVAARSAERMKQLNTMRAKETFSAEFGVAAQGMTMKIKLNGAYDVESSKEPYGIHMKGKLSFMNREQETDAYVLREGDRNVQYVWDESQQVYLSSVADEADLTGLNLNEVMTDGTRSWEMEQTDQTFVLHTELPMDQKALAAMPAISQIFGELELPEDALIPITVTVDSESMYVTAASFDLDAVVGAMFSSILGAAYGEDSEVTGTMRVEMELTDHDAPITIQAPENSVPDPSKGEDVKVRERSDFSNEELAQVHPMLFRVTGQNGEKMYLLGTIHVGDGRSEYALDALKPYVDECDALALEYDMRAFEEDLQAQMDAGKLMLLDDGTSIQDHLPEELYTRAASLLRAAGINPGMMEAYKPGMWYSLVEQAAMAGRCSQSPEYGMDQLLVGYSYDMGQEVRSVESAESQYKLLAGISDELGRLLIEEVLDHLNEYGPRTAELYDAWCSGDYEAIVALLEEEDETDEEDYTPDELKILEDFNDQMVTQRNRFMLGRAAEWLKSGDKVFFAVGTAHIAGEGALVELLRQEGYTVEQVFYAN